MTDRWCLLPTVKKKQKKTIAFVRNPQSWVNLGHDIYLYIGNKIYNLDYRTTTDTTLL